MFGHWENEGKQNNIEQLALLAHFPLSTFQPYSFSINRRRKLIEEKQRMITLSNVSPHNSTGSNVYLTDEETYAKWSTQNKTLDYTSILANGNITLHAKEMCRILTVKQIDLVTWSNIVPQREELERKQEGEAAGAFLIGFCHPMKRTDERNRRVLTALSPWDEMILWRLSLDEKLQIWVKNSRRQFCFLEPSTIDANQTEAAVNTIDNRQRARGTGGVTGV